MTIIPNEPSWLLRFRCSLIHCDCSRYYTHTYLCFPVSSAWVSPAPLSVLCWAFHSVQPGWERCSLHVRNGQRSWDRSISMIMYSRFFSLSLPPPLSFLLYFIATETSVANHFCSACRRSLRLPTQGPRCQGSCSRRPCATPYTLRTNNTTAHSSAYSGSYG